MIGTFRSDAAKDVRETYEFRIEGEVFHVRVEDGGMEAKQGSAPKADLVITCDAEAFLAVSSRSISPRHAASSGRMEIQGDPAALARCFEIFGLTAVDAKAAFDA